MKDSIKGRGFGSGWAAELFLMFFSGFGLATLLWLGVWFFYAQPAHTAELGTKEAALEAKQTSLEQLATANDHCNALKDKLQTENEEISGKLNAALSRNFHFELHLHPKTYASYPVVSIANRPGLFEVVVRHISAVLRSRCAGFACPACLAADTYPARPLLST